MAPPPFPHPPLFFHRASPPGPLSPYALRRGSSSPMPSSRRLFFPYALLPAVFFPYALLPAALLPLCPPPCGLLPLMPSAGGPPPICSLVRAVRSAKSSLWGAAVGGEAGSRAGDSAHRTGAARAARPGRLCSGGRRWRRRRRRSVYCAPFPSRGVEPPHRAPRRCGRCPPSRRALIRPGRRLAGAVEDGEVRRRTPNTSGALWTSTPRRLPTPCG